MNNNTLMNVIPMEIDEKQTNKLAIKKCNWEFLGLTKKYQIKLRTKQD